jgi:transcriptional regulator with XRE-family HTH domain
MSDLWKRFGRLLAAHRRRRGLTQEALAEGAEVSPDTIAKIETGVTGARFPVIERLATALEIDPAELFTTEIPAGAIRRGTFAEISTSLAQLAEGDLVWVRNLLDAALTRRGVDEPAVKSIATPPRKTANRPRRARVARRVRK